MHNLPYLQGLLPNFLRSRYSYTECQLSYLTESCSKVRISAGYSSYLLYYWFLPTQLIYYLVLTCSGRYNQFFIVGMDIFYSFHCFLFTGSSSRTLLNISFFWYSARSWIIIMLQILSFSFFLYATGSVKHKFKKLYFS